MRSLPSPTPSSAPAAAYDVWRDAFPRFVRDHVAMSLESCVVDGRAWRDGVMVDTDVTAADLRADTGAPDTIYWVDLLRPSREAMTELAQRFDLPPTTVEDALAPFERPKVTNHGRVLFFTVLTATWAPEHDPQTTSRLGSQRLSGVVTPRILITIRLDDTLSTAMFLERWTENAELLTEGTGALLHGVLDAIVDQQFETIQSLDEVVDDVEAELFEGDPSRREFVQRIFWLRKDLVVLRRVVLPMREVVTAVVRRRARTGSDLDHWYDDLYDHVLRAADWGDSLRDVVGSLYETNLSLQDNRLNDIMKKLAAWGGIIAVPTAITGWFGQNVPYAGFGHTWGVWASAISILAISGGLYAAFRARDWL